MKAVSIVLPLLTAFCLNIESSRAAKVDVIVVVDESGSMSGEHAWLPGMITGLDDALSALGHTGRYGLVGFGGGGVGDLGRQLLVGGGDFGTAAEFGIAAAGLTTSGGFEDGYSGLDFAFSNYASTSDTLVNYILVTDEDRDNGNNSLTYESILGVIRSRRALLNAVLDNPFACDAGSALGINWNGSAYVGYQEAADGGFTGCGGGVAGNGFGNTESDYVPMALNSGGAAWDLNQLRAGGNTAASFTQAFINIKVEEIGSQAPIPEPGTLTLGGVAALCLLVVQRRKQRTGNHRS